MDRICIIQYLHGGEQISAYKDVGGYLIIKRGDEEVNMRPHEWLECILGADGDHLDEEVRNSMELLNGSHTSTGPEIATAEYDGAEERTF